MDRVDLWRARLALKTLTRERRQAIAEAAEDLDTLITATPAQRRPLVRVSIGAGNLNHTYDNSGLRILY